MPMLKPFILPKNQPRINTNNKAISYKHIINI